MASTLSITVERATLIKAARDIEKLAHANVAPDTFFRKFLGRLTEALGAQGGAVWVLDRQGVLSMVCASGSQRDSISFDTQRLADRRHVQRLLDVLQQRQPQIDRDTSAEESQSPHVLLLVPMHHQDRPLGALELSLSADAPEEVRRECLQFAEEMAAYASRYLTWREEAGSAEKQLAFWRQFEDTLVRLHRSLNSTEVAAVAVNDGRQLVGCERVSVVTRRGGKNVVLAISGQDRVNNRSNLVRSLRRLAGAVTAGGEPLLYTGDLNAVPPALEGPLTDYLRESGARMVKLIPLKQSGERRAKNGEPESKWPNDTSGSLFAALRSARSRPLKSDTFGVLVIEQMSERWLTPLMDERSEMLAEHTAEALHNARSQENILLLPVWRLLGRCFGWFRGRNVLKAAVVVGLLVGTVSALACVPWEYRVEAAGKLMPVIQRDVFAPWEGEVVEIYVTSGQRVAKGEKLLRLRNDELDAQLLSLRSRLDERRQLLSALKAEIDEDNRRITRDEEIRLRGRLAQTNVEIEGLEGRLRTLHEQIDRLTVRSPIAGTIATFQLEQRLMHRPVQRGEVLLEVMDESGDWRLEVELPEGRMGHLLAAQAAKSRKRRVESREPETMIGPPLPALHSPRDEGLPVEFVLATVPEKRFTGTLSEMATRTDLSPEQGAVVELQVAVDRDQIPHRRIGAEVRAKIGCGQKSLAYVLFGDLVEFVQRRFW